MLRSIHSSLLALLIGALIAVWAISAPVSLDGDSSDLVSFVNTELQAVELIYLDSDNCETFYLSGKYSLASDFDYSLSPVRVKAIKTDLNKVSVGTRIYTGRYTRPPPANNSDYEICLAPDIRANSDLIRDGTKSIKGIFHSYT